MPQQPWGRAARRFLLHTLGLHPPLIAFGSATRGHEEPNFGGFTAKQLPFSYRRNRVTELRLAISAVPNQAADREGRTWRFPFEGRKSKNIPLCIPLFLFLFAHFIFCTPDDVYRKQTQLCPLAVGMCSSRRKRSRYAPVSDLLSAAWWKHAKGNVALECNVSFPFYMLHDYCFYHDTDDTHSLDIQKFYRKLGPISFVTT